MIFNCKEIFITDETLGCSLTFAEKENFKNDIVDDFKKNEGQYLMLLRIYKEDECEEDFLYIETKDPLKSGEIKVFVIHIYPNKFSICYEKDEIEIGLNVNEKELDNLKHIIKKIANQQGQINFHTELFI